VVVAMVELGNQSMPGANAFEDAARAIELAHEQTLGARSYQDVKSLFALEMQSVAERVRRGAFHPSRLAEVSKLVDDYKCEIGLSGCIPLAGRDYFEHRTAQLELKLQPLHHPKPAPTERERLGSVIAKAWNGPRGCPELDELFQAMKLGEHVVSFDWEKAIVRGPEGERTLTRRALRLRSRPAYSTFSEDEWCNRFGPIRPPE
jgi:hypothetical protein